MAATSEQQLALYLFWSSGETSVWTWQGLAGVGEALQIPDVSQIVPGRQGAGIRFRTFLEQQKPDDATIHKISLQSSQDQFEKSIEWELIPEEAVLLYQLEDKPLPVEKGGPFRLLVPGTVLCGKAELDNCVNVKFLDRIEIEISAD